MNQRQSKKSPSIDLVVAFLIFIICIFYSFVYHADFFNDLAAGAN